MDFRPFFNFMKNSLAAWSPPARRPVHAVPARQHLRAHLCPGERRHQLHDDDFIFIAFRNKATKQYNVVEIKRIS